MQQYNTRVRLKTDTTVNWEKIHSTFIPLSGEIIIYQDDYARLKVGDGTTVLADLPFIDAGSINGTQVEIVKVTSYNDLTSAISSPDKLYITTNNGQLYYYNTTSHTYVNLSTYNISKLNIRYPIEWNVGSHTSFTTNNHILFIQTGVTPNLTLGTQEVVVNVTRE